MADAGDACIGDCDGGPGECEDDDDCEGDGTCEDGQCVDPSPECDDGDDCESGVCTNHVCAAATCEDEVQNGDETDVDCGGPECDPCELEASCVDGDDCASSTCIAMTCVAPGCGDGEMNGDETDVDCGGTACAACGEGSTCGEDADCASAVCEGGACAAAACDDETQNGEETGEDCGGPDCEPCADGLGCAEAEDCLSGVCGEDETCSAPTCDDGVQNGGETGQDCGGAGSCDRCERGASCSEDADCASDHCEEDACVDEPTAGFTLTTLFADIDREITATSTATSGGGEITTIEYDWGTGFAADDSHTFQASGEFPVTQRVTDEYGYTATATLMVDVFHPVRLSTTDKSANVVVLSDVELRMIHNQQEGGVRSHLGVGTGSGVSYFEMTQLGRTGGGGFGAGVATAMQALNTFLGSTTQSVGMNANGIAWYNGGFLGNFGHSDTIGFVVDYRGANPIVHIITADGSGNSVRRVEQTMTGVTAPLFAAFSGSPESHGPIARFNFGSDTENHPFVLDPVAALGAADEASTAAALTMGFGRTRARPHSEAPELTVSDTELTVAVDTEVELTATATDAEDGTLTEAIEWENLAESYYVRDTGLGGTFAFTPTEIGKYPIRVYVSDSAGVVTEETVMVTVTGTLPQFDPVQLVVNSDTGAGVMLDPTGLQALYTVDLKMAVHANQGIYGRFWYFEAQRLTGPGENIGCGLVVSRGSLNPLAFETTQPSLQVNFIGSAWRDLIFQANAASASGYYGFAVDYRGDHPTIYVIVDNAVIYRTTLEHVWVPLYPMLYGNPTTSMAAYDNRINFGATAFQFNPVTALNALPDDVIAPADVAELEVGWGDANTAD